MLEAEDVSEPADYRFFLSAYDGDGRMLKTTIVETDTEGTAAVYVEELSWSQVKLFLLDRTTSVPLTKQATYRK